jgi:predicted transcriptional regulator
MHKLRSLSRRERQIMDVVFGSGSATAGEIRERMPDPPSYSAVRATLRVLEQKGVLKHEVEGLRNVYRPAVNRSRARRGAVEHLVETFFGGSAAGAVLSLLEQPGTRLTREELDRLTALIERARTEER